jgi:hypothetical protein
LFYVAYFVLLFKTRKMKTTTLVIAFLFCSAMFANNNNEDKPKSFSINGKVTDKTESLTGVKVILDNQELTVYTDFDGNFTIDNVLEGEHTLSFSYVTYDNKIITINPSGASKVEVELTEK